MGVSRVKAPQAPKHLVTTHLSAIIQGAVHLGLAFAVGFATWAGVWLGSLLGGLGINPFNIAAASILGTMVGLVFGALALVFTAATGHVRASVFATIGVAIVMFLINSISILNDTLESIAAFTPFDYYLSNEPLSNGMDWSNLSVLVIAFVALIVVAILFFDRRDLRQTG